MNRFTSSTGNDKNRYLNKIEILSHVKFKPYAVRAELVAVEYQRPRNFLSGSSIIHHFHSHSYDPKWVLEFKLLLIHLCFSQCEGGRG